jgi:hypothetical protein
LSRTLAFVALAGLVFVGGVTHSQAAPLPNLLVNGGFELPVTPTGQAVPPFGTCGAPVTIEGATAALGCWTLVSGPAGSAYVDRAFAYGSKQSLAFHPPGGACCTYTQLWQPVVAGPGTYRLQFRATSDSPAGANPLTVSIPMAVTLASEEGGTATAGAEVQFGPAYVASDSAGLIHQWIHYSVDLTAPTGTDHLVVGIYSNGAFGPVQARLDGITLKQIS